MRIAQQATLGAVLAFAGAAASQSGTLTTIAVMGQPVPGVSGPYTFDDFQNGVWVAVGEGGHVALLQTLNRTNSASRTGAFVAGPNLPLTNLADTNTDTAIAEFGPDGIAALWLRGGFGGPNASGESMPRIDESGRVLIRAELDTPVLMPDGQPSTSVTLLCEPGQTPVVMARASSAPPATGGPVGLWYELERSPDGDRGCFLYQNGIDTEQIWSVENDAADQRLVTSSDPASAGDAAIEPWSGWIVRDIDRHVIGNSGLIAFRGRVFKQPFMPLNDHLTLFVGTPEAGYAPLYDSRVTAQVYAGVGFAETVGTVPSAIRILPDNRVVVEGGVLDADQDYQRAVWLFETDGTNQLLLREDESAPGFGPQDIVLSINEVVPTFGGRTAIRATVGDPDFIDWQRCVYIIEADGTLSPRADVGRPVSVPGRTGGPFTLADIWDAPHIIENGQMILDGRVEADDGSSFRSVVYSTLAGDLRALAPQGDLFDYDPTGPGGEFPISDAVIESVNASGVVALRLWSGTPRTAIFRASVADTGCPVDVNGDGIVSPADFNAWVLAFNSQSPACDQNGDGACTPADFNAWILSFNAGC